jgi:hypothetical protein
MSQEPVVIVTAIVTVLADIVALLVTGNVLQITPDEQKLLLLVITNIGAFVGAIWSRSKVTPV